MGDEEELVDTAAHEFDVNAPIYVGGVPRGFESPAEILVSSDKSALNRCNSLTITTNVRHTVIVLKIL